MKVLIVSRYKKQFSNHILPFVWEQGEAVRQLGCEVEYFPVQGSYLRAFGALRRKIAGYKPDIIHAHYGLSAMVAEWQSQVPVVTTFHNGETLHKSVNFITSLFSLRAKHVIYVAQHIRDLAYFKAGNYSIIPCGVSLEDCRITDKQQARQTLHFQDGVKYILFGGGFDNTRKNYQLLRAAVELVCSNDEWVSVEGGEQRGNIVCLEMRGLSRAECVLRMCACDVFALPSHSEGSPQALKEAMACNCPVVATDVADVRSLLGDLDGHYILRNPRNMPEYWEQDSNSVHEMAELLRQALSFPARTEGRKRIIDLGLSNEQVARRIISIYNNIVNNQTIPQI